jgi:two-component system response regulator FlrC
MNPVSTLSPQQLEQAFQVFNLASSDLCLAYEELRQQALVLAQELALANGELRRQLAEKEALRESVQRLERLAVMDMKSLERAHIMATLLAVNGSRKRAVQRLGISERALRYKLQQYRLEGGIA